MNFCILFKTQESEFTGLNDFKFFPIRAQHPDLTQTGMGWFLPMKTRYKDNAAEVEVNDRTRQVYKRRR